MRALPINLKDNGCGISTLAHCWSVAHQPRQPLPTTISVEQ